MTDLRGLTAPWQEPALSGTIAQGRHAGDKICITEEHIQKGKDDLSRAEGSLWPGNWVKVPAGAP